MALVFAPVTAVLAETFLPGNACPALALFGVAKGLGLPPGEISLIEIERRVRALGAAEPQTIADLDPKHRLMIDRVSADEEVDVRTALPSLVVLAEALHAGVDKFSNAAPRVPFSPPDLQRCPAARCLGAPAKMCQP